MAIKVTVITDRGAEPGVLIRDTIVCEPLPEQLTVVVDLTLMADVNIEDLEPALNDPHTALDIPRNFIVDDITVHPLSATQEA